MGKERKFTPEGLPVVLREDVDQISETIDGASMASLEELLERAQTYDANVSRVVEALLPSVPPHGREHFKFGADLARITLMHLESKGLRFPQVDDDTALAMVAEYQAVIEVLQTQFHPVKSVAELLSVMGKLRPQVEFNFPTPEMYQEENPHFFDLLKGRNGFARIGGAVVYDLKRRQASSEKVSAMYSKDSLPDHG